MAPEISQNGWVGYEKREGEPETMAVYFYCGNPQARQKILSRLGNFQTEEQAGDFTVRVATDARKSGGDKNWFLKVIDSVVPKVAA